jgi:adenylate cyclase
MIDKFVGDEVIGLFFAGISGNEHTDAAIRAGRALVGAVSRADASPSGPIPVGAAVHTGNAFVGSTGAEGAVSDFTALGDAVNTTARLAGQAAAGELLVSVDAASAGGLDLGSFERRTLAVRGRSDAIEVLAVRV